MKKLFIILFSILLISCEKECRIYECVDENGNIEQVNIINIDLYEEYDCECEEYFN
jgi:hypothetical protein